MRVLSIIPLVAAFQMSAGCALIPNIEEEVNACEDLRNSHLVQEQMKKSRSQGKERLIIKSPSSTVGKKVNCVYEL
jgi:hypothetical protein